MGQVKQLVTPTVQPTPMVIQVIQPQSVNWGQAFTDGGFAFVATLFGFILALWWERRKTAAATKAEQAEEKERHERRKNILSVALLRELKAAFDEFSNRGRNLNVSAERILPTLYLETTGKEQLELFVFAGIHKQMLQVVPIILAYKFHYNVCLETHVNSNPGTMNYDDRGANRHNFSSRELNSLWPNGRNVIRELAMMLIAEITPDVPKDLDLDKWGS